MAISIYVYIYIYISSVYHDITIFVALNCSLVPIPPGHWPRTQAVAEVAEGPTNGSSWKHLAPVSLSSVSKMLIVQSFFFGIQLL